MSAWGRLALIQGAIADLNQPGVLADVAEQQGYELKPELLEDLEGGFERGREKKDDKTTDISKLEDETLKPTSPKLEPLTFLVVKSVKHLQQNTEKPSVLSGPTLPLPKDGKNINGLKPSLQFAAPEELMCPARYLPLLHNALGQNVTTKRLAAKAISKRMGQGKPLYRVPRLTRHRWPQRLLIIVDTHNNLMPYWGDFANAVSALIGLLGKESVTCITFEEQSLHSDCARYRYWGLEANRADEPYHYDDPLINAESILLLSDLGALNGEYNQHGLSRYLRRSINPSASILTLCPVLPKPHAKVVAELNATQWLAGVPMPRQPRENRNQQGTEDDLVDLIAALVFIPVVDMGLLRKIRKALKIGTSGLEGKVWNHPHMAANQVGNYVDGRYKNIYQTRYQSRWHGTQEEEILHRLVAEHHKNAPDGLIRLEHLHLSYAENNLCGAEQITQAAAYFASLAATVDQGPDKINLDMVKAQCKNALHSLPEMADGATAKNHSQTALLLAAMAYRDEIGPDQWPNELPQAMKRQLRWATGTSEIKKVRWSLDLTSNRGNIGFDNSDAEQSRDKLANRGNWYIEAEVGMPLEVQPPKSYPTNLYKAKNSTVLESASQPEQKQLKFHFLSKSSGAPPEEISINRPATITQPTQTSIPKGHSVTIRSSLMEVEVCTLARESYIGKMGYRNGTLYQVPKYLPDNYKVKWHAIHIEPNESTWSWDIPHPAVCGYVFKDDYGYYIDLDLAGYIQKFRWIEPGEFIMGSPESEVDRFVDETQHLVTLTQGFWLADTATNHQLWQVFDKNNPSKFKNKEHPVEKVSWDDVQKWLARVTENTGLSLRLPTEAEWEYACRAGTQTRYSWGDEITPEDANYQTRETRTVKSFAPNPWGLYQMHGNVYEWCHDWFDDYPDTATDPEGPASGAERVLRGGSWCFSGRDLRCAGRYGSVPDFRNDFIGFRLALGHELKSGGAAGPEAAAAEQQAGPVKPGGGLGKLIKGFTGKK